MISDAPEPKHHIHGNYDDDESQLDDGGLDNDDYQFTVEEGRDKAGSSDTENEEQMSFQQPSSSEVAQGRNNGGTKPPSTRRRE